MMSFGVLLSMMLFSVLLFCGMAMYVYRSWTHDAKEAEYQRLALDENREELSSMRSGLEKEREERARLEKQLVKLKKELDLIAQERRTDRTAYQSLFDQLENQLQQKEREVIHSSSQERV